MVLVPICGTELLKPWNFLSEESDQGAFCSINKVTFEKPLGNLRMGEPTMWLEGWNFQSHALTFGEQERRAGVESIRDRRWFSQSCLGNEASTHSPKDWSLENSWVEEHTEMSGEWHSRRDAGSSVSLSHIPHPVPLHLAVHLYCLA